MDLHKKKKKTPSTFCVYDRGLTWKTLQVPYECPTSNYFENTQNTLQL